MYLLQVHLLFLITGSYHIKIRYKRFDKFMIFEFSLVKKSISVVINFIFICNSSRFISINYMFDFNQLTIFAGQSATNSVGTQGEGAGWYKRPIKVSDLSSNSAAPTSLKGVMPHKLSGPKLTISRAHSAVVRNPMSNVSFAQL